MKDMISFLQVFNKVEDKKWIHFTEIKLKALRTVFWNEKLQEPKYYWSQDTFTRYPIMVKDSNDFYRDSWLREGEEPRNQLPQQKAKTNKDATARRSEMIGLVGIHFHAKVVDISHLCLQAETDKVAALC